MWLGIPIRGRDLRDIWGGERQSRMETLENRTPKRDKKGVKKLEGRRRHWNQPVT